jgi:hypothetical protein
LERSDDIGRREKETKLKRAYSVSLLSQSPMSEIETSYTNITWLQVSQPVFAW